MVHDSMIYGSWFMVHLNLFLYQLSNFHLNLYLYQPSNCMYDFNLLYFVLLSICLIERLIDSTVHGSWFMIHLNLCPYQLSNRVSIDSMINGS
ncbi:hypothetical protein BCR32DRAFT_282038 [Anaeromyces robustus]|uniref:Uncharacterized protein n=1 Tax=Anaeromyces robustus TaxID=1754192 RepID=A0A1Y1WZR2_9FUNG|nr:hypothetical protein BCR32DRAFT_282038 [Anaeromyces robustus]|eukprot:ORX78676.1 hypothetical protein BCR32DRAFT_282038 [Anaeromyces robustus]